MDQEELPYHVPLTYRVGQRVTVKAVITSAHAWYGEDPNEEELRKVDRAVHIGVRLRKVDRAVHIGVRHKVEAEHPLFGYYCSAPKMSALWYPSCALAPIDGGACIVEVPSVNADNLGGK